MSLTAGVRLGPYEILDLIGAGGMGEVYRARDTKLNRDVALKVLPELFALDPADGQRFLVNTFEEDSTPSPITVVVNWAAGVKER